MNKLTLVLISFCLSSSTLAQKSKVTMRHANSITQEDLMDYLSILASDSLERRGSLQQGSKLATAFISTHFEKQGLASMFREGGQLTYLQPMSPYSYYFEDSYLILKGTKYANLKKFPRWRKHPCLCPIKN